MKYSFYDTLSLYGFSQEQKFALQNLMRNASILENNQSIQEMFPDRNNQDDFLRDLVNFVKLTQKKFVIRSGAQERWEVSPHEWMTANTTEIFGYLTTLNMINSIDPTDISDSAFCVLGATKPTMEIRVSYTLSLINKGLQASELILLSGERCANNKSDAPQEKLEEISAHYQLESVNELTETHLIRYIYENSELSNKISAYVIDTPKRDLPRPTTQTTIIELIEWLKQHEDIKKIVFVSNQPFINYQKAIIAEVLRYKNCDINFEVVGDSYLNKETQSPIEALGSFIFAATPNVLVSLNESITNPEIIAEFRELYKNNSLVYSDLVLSHVFTGVNYVDNEL